MMAKVEAVAHELAEAELAEEAEGG